MRAGLVTSDGKCMISEVVHFTTSDLIMLKKSRCNSSQIFELLDFSVYLARIGQVRTRFDRVIASLASTSQTSRDLADRMKDEVLRSACNLPRSTACSVE